MEDVQNLKDYRQLEIDKVGVKNIKYPITVLDKSNGLQKTVASVNMYVNLPHDHKGTHMSRFIEILNKYRKEITIKNISQILEEMKLRLNAASAHLEITFPYFIEKLSPITAIPGLMEYTCYFKGSIDGTEKTDLLVGVRVPVTTLCPCSKEISSFGAHNQRGEVSVHVRFKRFFWLEDLITLVEECASAQVYSVLKREDEKYVTEQAYMNPMFVEDVVREISLRLLSDDNFTWFSVDSENFESIHNHNAYAYIERDKRKNG